MTFDEFKSLALKPPYDDSHCVYRVDIHRYVKPFKNAKDVTCFEVKLCQSFMYTDIESVRKRIPYYIHSERYNKQLYTVYIYELPLNCDVSDGQYQRLWVYGRNGILIAQSMCSTLLESLDCQYAKFRGHDSKGIRFNPGDIVEVYDRENNQVRLGVVIKQPPTIEQCWDMRNEVAKACVAEGISTDKTDDNYWLYAIDDCYCVSFGPDYELTYPHSTDVFTPMYPITDNMRLKFDDLYHYALETHCDEINDSKITVKTTIERLNRFKRIIDSY